MPGLVAERGTPPGPRLAGELAAARLDQLDEFGLLELMREGRRLTAWAESVELAAMAELDRRRQAQADRNGMGSRAAAEALVDEVSAALTLSGTAAAHRIGLAIALERLLPDTGPALAEGVIDSGKAKVLADGIIGLSTDVARGVERIVLPEAPLLTSRQLAARVRLAVVEADPAAFERRRESAVRDRRVELHDNPHGTRDLAGRDLPADAADAAFNYVNALAGGIKADGDDRALDAIRADVLLRLLRGTRPEELARAEEPVAAPVASGDPACGTEQVREAAEITEVVRQQITELLEQVRAAGRADPSRLLVAEAAHRMKDAISALKGRWCVDATGRAGARVHGHDGYRPPAAMRRMVINRDGTCRFPTCRARAARCDHDHTLAHHRGGPTCPCNLGLLCRRHHRLKQGADWTLIQLWPGVLLWISPTGHCYTVGPDPG
ncbi:MAG: hypothetical protein JWO67_334 [Streptosporangiaceae bacterium]|nr:hypothetical protein [Streptosporangiaceae bacterium]